MRIEQEVHFGRSLSTVELNAVEVGPRPTFEPGPPIPEDSGLLLLADGTPLLLADEEPILIIRKTRRKKIIK